MNLFCLGTNHLTETGPPWHLLDLYGLSPKYETRKDSHNVLYNWQNPVLRRRMRPVSLRSLMRDSETEEHDPASELFYWGPHETLNETPDDGHQSDILRWLRRDDHSALRTGGLTTVYTGRQQDTYTYKSTSVLLRNCP